MSHPFTRIAEAAVLLFALIVLAVPFPAYACGDPPDPRWDRSGYESWCSCMGGSYNYQTTACTGATGRSRSSGPSSSSGPTGAPGMWYCRAEARDGSHGWAEYASESRARSEALGYCHSYSKGRPCSIKFCRLGGAASSPSSQTRSAPKPETQSRSSARPAAYDCSLCLDKLLADVQSGWASARIQTYVPQSIAGYENCKRKASGICLRGDLLAARLKSCAMFTSDDPYRACIKGVAR